MLWMWEKSFFLRFGLFGWDRITENKLNGSLPGFWSELEAKWWFSAYSHWKIHVHTYGVETNKGFLAVWRHPFSFFLVYSMKTSTHNKSKHASLSKNTNRHQHTINQPTKDSTSWPQYTLVGFGKELSVTHNDWYICSAVPSKNFPQPATNYNKDSLHELQLPIIINGTINMS